MPIRQLAPDVAAKIAAGEVVERPASVVKELIENSIDAGATSIRVDLMNGGLQLIRVTDNGSGIPIEELPLALSRHATSKVAQIDDLEHIRSLGFRGEALASIAAVADVTLLSRSRGSEQGAQIHASNGTLSEVSAAASPEGTTLTVRNLFSAVPARLKFLKSRNTEVSHCHHMLEQYALAYPEIRFSVFSEGRQIFATAGDGQIASVLLEIYGLQATEQMVRISSLDGHDEDPLRPVVNGYTSLPACYKSTRQHISFFVNRRWVMSRILTTAVEEAYHSLLLPGRHPIAVVNIALDPTLLDVNVHPAKTEIRFLKERRVYAAILRAVRQTLLSEAQMPTWSHDTTTVGAKQTLPVMPVPSEQSPETEPPPATDMLDDPDVSNVSNVSDASNVSDLSDDISTSDFPQDNPWLTVTEEETGTRPPLLSRLWQSHIRTPEPSQKTEHNGTSSQSPAAPLADAVPNFQAGTIPNFQNESSGKPENDDIQNVATPLVGVVGDGVGSRLPQLRVVGQLSQSYIVTEGPDGMYLIDQHAAHERILLERMVAALQARVPLSQLLLTPIVLELAPKELESIEEHAEQLEYIGFAIEITETQELQVRAVPHVLIKQMNARSLHELLTDLTAPESMGTVGHTETWEEHALANVACKAAIKQHYFLTVSEMREMIEQLEETNAPFSCCHGRPTMVHFSLSALEREFGRR